MVEKWFAGLSHDLEVLGLITATFSLFSGEPDVLKFMFGVSVLVERMNEISTLSKAALIRKNKFGRGTQES